MRTVYPFQIIAISVLLTGILIGLSHCAPAKKTVNTPRPAPTDANALFHDYIQPRQISYTWFNGSGKALFENADLRVQFTFQIRMQRDSFLWASVQKFGFEISRIMLRPDTSQILDRFNKIYYVVDTRAYLRDYDIDLSFGELQDLIAGSPPVIHFESGTLKRTPDVQQLVIENTKPSRIIYSLNPMTYELMHAHLQEGNDRSVSVKYNSFRDLPDQQTVAYHRNHTLLVNQEEAIFDLKFDAIEINTPKSIRFDIPDHYTRLD